MGFLLCICFHIFLLCIMNFCYYRFQINRNLRLLISVLGANFRKSFPLSQKYEKVYKFEQFHLRLSHKNAEITFRFSKRRKLRAMSFSYLSQKCGNLRKFICSFRAKMRNCAEIAFRYSKVRKLRASKNFAKLETLIPGISRMTIL